MEQRPHALSLLIHLDHYHAMTKYRSWKVSLEEAEDLLLILISMVSSLVFTTQAIKHCSSVVAPSTI